MAETLKVYFKFSFDLPAIQHVLTAAQTAPVEPPLSLVAVVVTQAYAGKENELVAFYYSGKALGLNNCADITPWLTRYKYDQTATIKLELMFNKSLMIHFPISS